MGTALMNNLAAAGLGLNYPLLNSAFLMENDLASLQSMAPTVESFNRTCVWRSSPTRGGDELGLLPPSPQELDWTIFSAGAWRRFQLRLALRMYRTGHVVVSFPLFHLCHHVLSLRACL